MPEYDFTTSAKILLIATIFLLIGFVTSAIFDVTGIFAIIFLGTSLLSLAAIYAAATDMSISSIFQKAKFVHDKPREGSAAFLFGFASAIFGLFPLILVLLSEDWNPNVALSAQIGGLGGILELIGAVKANLEWNEW